GSLEEIESCLKELVRFYPAHIEKEDKHFFYPCLEYLSEKEQQDMLQEAEYSTCQKPVKNLRVVGALLSFLAPCGRGLR
ncbi:MAG: hypothetical protein Q7J73_02050, partial [Dehalococcoidales bacterium]|nr:hypothetical protein [Dehalococcoidales bacterium]